MKTKLTKNKNILYAALCTFLFSFMILGFIIAEKNTRAVAFGDTTPLIYINYNGPCHRLDMSLFYKKYSIDFSSQQKTIKNIGKNLSLIIKRPYFN